MSSLFGTLTLATGALQAEQGALNATTNNVANVNTPGYSRLQPILVENSPIVTDSLTYGTGVSLQKLQAVRDPILQLRIQEETQQQGQLNTLVSSLQQVQVNFTASSGDIGSQISNLFSSLDQLSTAPTNLSLRQGVLTAAANLATTFNNRAKNLAQQRSSLDLNVSQDVTQINTLTAQIAGLNTQISGLQGLGQDASAFVDQRDVLIGQLSNLVDVSEIQSDNGLTLTTSNGTALVVGGQSFSLTTQNNAAGFQDVFSQGQDITAKLTSGELAGTIQVRDQTIPGLLSNLDTLASGLANGLNAANAGGFDGNGDPGSNIFVPPPANGAGYASNIALQITDPALIAASSDGSAGSNGNVAALSAVATQSLAQIGTPNLNEQDSPPSAGTLNANDVLTVGGQTSVSAGGTTFTYTNAVTAGANLNEVTGASVVAASTPLASGDVVTATRGGNTTIYTATAATTVGNLITAINRGVSGAVAGTNITVSGTDPSPGGYQATLAGGKLQIVDLNGNNNLSVAQNSGAEFGVFTPNAAATSTLQDLINAINTDVTVGAKAALVGGQLQITDPQNRGNLAVTTTDSLLGAAVAGVPSAFAAPDVSTGQNPTDYYSNIVFGVGNDVANSTAELSSSQLVLQQLQDQRGQYFGSGPQRRGQQHGAISARFRRCRQHCHHGQRHALHRHQHGDINRMSSIRVNPYPLPDLLAALQQVQQQQNVDNLELATGNKINQPSDDPAGAAQLTQIDSQSQQVDSFQRSVSSLSDLLSTGDSTLNSVETALQRAISLGVEGANGTLSDSDRADVSAELTGIQSQLVSLANTSYQGQYLFSGTATSQPFVEDATAPSGVRYAGNSGVNRVTIGTGYQLQVNQPGSQIFNGPGADVFQSIHDLIAALNTNTGIPAAVTEVSSAFSYVTAQRVFYGNGMNQTESQQTYLSTETLGLTQQANNISAADVAAVATQLTQDQVAISATLASIGRSPAASLFDYLK